MQPTPLDDPPDRATDFSLVLGGPLFQLLRRAHLADDGLRLLWQRITVISLVSWLPLLVLSALQGQVIGGGITVPFLFDVDVHARFLLALPLLVGAELIVHRRMRAVVKSFLDRRLIPDDAIARFNGAVASALRLRNSVLAELLLLAAVYGVGILIVWRQYMVLDAATWYAAPSAGGSTLSMAGIWFGYVSLPLFQFLLMRWYYRLFIWIRFLWQVSRIELRLMPSHPDRVGGLGFLSQVAYALGTIAMAHGALLAGQLANRILYLGAKLPDYQLEIGATVAFVVCILLGPLMVFAPQLAAAKRRGLGEYGTLAQRYVREFDAKWLRGGAPADEVFVGSADIQSLADLGNSFELTRSMRLAPVTRDNVIQISAVTLAPVAPLLLTMMPLEQILQTIGGVIF